MKSRAAAALVVQEPDVKEKIQVLWRCYHDHAQGVLRVRYHCRPGQSKVRMTASSVPALKAELDAWLRSAIEAAGMTADVKPEIVDVFYRQFDPTGSIYAMRSQVNPNSHSNLYRW